MKVQEHTEHISRMSTNRNIALQVIAQKYFREKHHQAPSLLEYQIQVHLGCSPSRAQSYANGIRMGNVRPEGVHNSELFVSKD